MEKAREFQKNIYFWFIDYAKAFDCVAAAVKSLQSCPTLCDPIDSSPPGSSVHGIFQAKSTGVGCHCLLHSPTWNNLKKLNSQNVTTNRWCCFLTVCWALALATHSCSCLENPRDGGAWWAALYGVAQNQTRLKRLSSSSLSLPKNWKQTFFTICIYL